MPDFSLKMRWECTSLLIPFLKKFTPSDIYTIYKQGNNVRIDLTLVSWDQLKAKRGNVSILFVGDEKRLMIIDNVKGTTRELFANLSPEQIARQADALISEKKFSGDFNAHDIDISEVKS